MKKEKTKFIKQNEEINLYPDPDMIFYLKRKGKSDQDIRSYEKLASFLKSTYSSTAYSFGYNFSESVISGIQSITKNSYIRDIVDDLSQVFFKVAAFFIFIVCFMLIYSYATQGDLSGIISIDPEALNDTRLISSILFNQ